MNKTVQTSCGVYFGITWSKVLGCTYHPEWLDVGTDTPGLHQH